MYQVMMASGDYFAAHEAAHEPARTIRHEASSSAAGSTAISAAGDSTHNSATNVKDDDTVPVYDAYTVAHPDGAVAVGVDEKHIAEAAIKRDAAKARKEIANAAIVAIKGCQAKIYRDLGASLRTTPAESG